jgi:A/G-specific adenine glycosylase
LNPLSHMNVSGHLIKWYQKHRRELPWRKTPDPYAIWLSEIILQQTRVEQGLPYYLRFINRFPAVTDLAQATEDEVLKLWQGLGYYSRARNLHTAAKTVMNAYKGIFPADYQQIRNLKGVGDYTAAAIASFAFDLPYAVVDGNVYRVLSRIYGEATPIDSGPGKKLFAGLAESLLDKKRPGLHNQAIMEFGALWCRPSNPECPSCPLQYNCIAFKEHKVAAFPVKGKTTRIKKRYFNYLLVRYNKAIYFNKRASGDIWAHLYELPLIETARAASFEKLMDSTTWKSYFSSGYGHLKSVKNYKVHKLSHQHIHTRLFELILAKKPKELFTSSFYKVEECNAGDYPVPKLVELILEDHLQHPD